MRMMHTTGTGDRLPLRGTITIIQYIFQSPCYSIYFKGLKNIILVDSVTLRAERPFECKAIQSLGSNAWIVCPKLQPTNGAMALSRSSGFIRWCSSVLHRTSVIAEVHDVWAASQNTLGNDCLSLECEPQLFCTPPVVAALCGGISPSSVQILATVYWCYRSKTISGRFESTT